MRADQREGAAQVVSRWTLGIAALMLVAACGQSSLEDTRPTTSIATSTASSSTSTTETTAPEVDPAGEPFLGIWSTFDQDGYSVELRVERDGDGYRYHFGDDHEELCDEFGAPVYGVADGRAEISDGDMEVFYQTVTCHTDWGSVEKPLEGSEVFTLEGGVLNGCYRQGRAAPCDGLPLADLVAADPRFDELVETYGLDWLVANYAGDGDIEAIVRRVLAPCEVQGGAPADVARWTVRSMPIGGLPRHVGCNWDGMWVFQRNDASVMFVLPEGALGGTIGGVGRARSNEFLVVFHANESLHYMRPGDARPIAIDEIPQENGWLRDAVPLGGEQLLIATDDGVTLYNLDGSQVWTIPVGPSPSTVLTTDAWWVAGNNGVLVRVPSDGAPPVSIDIPDAVWGGNPGLRPAPTLVAAPGGIWVTNAGSTIQFVSDEGDLGQKMEVGRPASGDGVHILPVRGIIADDVYLYASDDDGDVRRFRLDGTGEPELVNQMPSFVTPGLVWFEDDAGLRAVDEDGVERAHLGQLPERQGTWWTWGHGALWISDQAGWLYRIGP